VFTRLVTDGRTGSQCRLALACRILKVTYWWLLKGLRKCISKPYWYWRSSVCW